MRYLTEGTPRVKDVAEVNAFVGGALERGPRLVIATWARSGWRSGRTSR